MCDAHVLSKGELSPPTSQFPARGSPGCFRGRSLLGEYEQHNLRGQTETLGRRGEHTKAVPVSDNHTHARKSNIPLYLNECFLFCFLCSQCGPDRDLSARPGDSESGAAKRGAEDAAATVSQLKCMRACLCLRLCCSFLVSVNTVSPNSSIEKSKKQ